MRSSVHETRRPGRAVRRRINMRDRLTRRLGGTRHKHGHRERHVSRLCWVAACAAALAAGLTIAFTVAPAGASGPEFADWKAVSNNTATGTLLGNSISLSGSHVSDPPASTVNGTSILFSDPQFTPPLSTTDAIEIRASSPAFSYTLQFGA